MLSTNELDWRFSIALAPKNYRAYKLEYLDKASNMLDE
jgi:hypothetical protein